MLEQEALIFSRYLIGREPNEQAVRLYIAAFGAGRPDNTDKKLLNFMSKHPRSIGFIDGGLVFHNPDSEARRRIYVMLAILEASPEHYDLFLPKERSPIYIAVVFYSGFRAIIKAALGIALVKVIT